MCIVREISSCRRGSQTQIVAAFGHPIVGDKVYGFGGCAAQNGGLEETENDVPESLQKAIDETVSNRSMCVHANRIQFVHPCTGEKLEFKSEAPF